MTNNENKLLEIAKEVIRLNKCNLEGLKLTGSLMLYVRGIRKKRDAKDIDFICDCIYEKDEGFPIMPKGFNFNDMEGSRSQIGCLQFINDEGIKIEFMASEERNVEIIDDVPCAAIEDMFLAKLRYVKNDENAESKSKHINDLIFLLEKNELIGE